MSLQNKDDKMDVAEVSILTKAFISLKPTL